MTVTDPAWQEAAGSGGPAEACHSVISVILSSPTGGGFLRHFAGVSGRWHHDRATAFCHGPLGHEKRAELLDFPGAGHHDRATASCHGLSWALRRGFALSGEGVVSSHSVEATGLVSRHRSEFGTLRAVRFRGLEAVGLRILGALKSLQKGRAALRSGLRARRCALKLFEGEAKGSEAVWGGGEGLGSCLRARRCARKLFEGEALHSEAFGGEAKGSEAV